MAKLFQITGIAAMAIVVMGGASLHAQQYARSNTAPVSEATAPLVAALRALPPGVNAWMLSGEKIGIYEADFEYLIDTGRVQGVEWSSFLDSDILQGGPYLTFHGPTAINEFNPEYLEHGVKTNDYSIILKISPEHCAELMNVSFGLEVGHWQTTIMDPDRGAVDAAPGTLRGFKCSAETGSVRILYRFDLNKIKG